MALTSLSVTANATPVYAFGSATSSLPFTCNVSVTGGNTTAGYADRLYVPAAQSIVAASPLSIDLSGSLVQPDGSACVFVRVKGIYIKNTSTTGYLTIGGGSNPLAGVTGFAGPGGVFLCTHDDGMTVIAATGDILKITASAGTVVAEIVVWGTSA